MKKLALTSFAVLVALIGFTAILVCLPCNNDRCGSHEGCEMSDGKCDGGKESCQKGNEKRIVKKWTDADGKVHEEVTVTVGDDGGAMGTCPMEMGDHSGCCGCCQMKNGGGHCNMGEGGDSIKVDTATVKVRGKL